MRKTLLTTTALVAGIAFAGVAQADNLGVGAGNVNDQLNNAGQVSSDTVVGFDDILSNDLDATSVGNAASQTAKNSGFVDVEGDQTWSEDPIAVGAGNLSIQDNFANQNATVFIRNYDAFNTTKGNDLDAVAVGNAADQTARNTGEVSSQVVNTYPGPHFPTAVGAGNVSLQLNVGKQTTDASIVSDSEVLNNTVDATSVGNSASQKAVNDADVDAGMTSTGYSNPNGAGFDVAVGAGNLSIQDNYARQKSTVSITTDGLIKNNELAALSVGNAASQTATSKAGNEISVEADIPGSGFASGALNLSGQNNQASQTASGSLTSYGGDITGNTMSATAVGNSVTQTATNASTIDVD